MKQWVATGFQALVTIPSFAMFVWASWDEFTFWHIGLALLICGPVAWAHHDRWWHKRHGLIA